ncbi:hypothetical protein [Streptomyces mirabilis]|uniref:hypothetical protein n=1 Tax=Streptomyces mirabilis TaxID=68239 RepID=UPI003328C848
MTATDTITDAFTPSANRTWCTNSPASTRGRITGWTRRARKAATHTVQADNGDRYSVWTVTR